MNQNVSNVIRQIHQRIPVRVRKSYGFLIRFSKNSGKHILPIYHCHCIERESGKPLSLLYIGREKKLLYYWLRRLSDDFEFVPGKKHIFRSQLSNYVKGIKNKVDLAIIESEKNADPVAYSRGFLLPRWMEMKLEFDTFKGKSRTRNIIRNIKKYGFEYEVREGLEDFDLFYHKMYAPFVKMRHQESADVSDYMHFKNKFQTEKALLFFALREGVPVAGAYIEERESIHRLATFGILDGSAEIHRMGVLGALYRFVISHLEERGEKAIFMGNSIPVISDGVTKFKAQIGAEPYLPYVLSADTFYFIPLSSSIPMIQVLKSNPFYYLWEQQLRAVYFLETSDFESRDEFLEFYKRHVSRAEMHTKLFCFDHPEKLKEWLGSLDAGRVEVYKYHEELIMDNIHQEMPFKNSVGKEGHGLA